MRYRNDTGSDQLLPTLGLVLEAGATAELPDDVVLPPTFTPVDKPKTTKPKTDTPDQALEG